MSKRKAILLPLLLLLGVLPMQVLAAEDSVGVTIEGDMLELDITGIDTTDKSQMISVSVIRSDAMEAPTKEDIVYADTIYTDGKDTLNLEIELDDIEAYEYHLVVSDKTGEISYAQPLAERPKELKIITQPVDASVIVGSDAVVSVDAEGDGLTYTWYYKNPGNVKFYASGTQFVDGNTYTIPMYAWRNGQQVYCVITDAYGNTVQTNTVTIAINTGSIVIIKNLDDVMVDTMGDTASLTVEATGEGLTYQWYYKNPGNKKFYLSGEQFVSEDDTTYTIPVAAWRDGQQVYCVITDVNGISVQTNIVTLSVAK